MEVLAWRAKAEAAEAELVELKHKAAARRQEEAAVHAAGEAAFRRHLQQLRRSPVHTLHAIECMVAACCGWPRGNSWTQNLAPGSSKQR